MREFLDSKEPGDNVTFTTESKNGIKKYNIELGQRPDNSGKAYIGIGNKIIQRRGFIQNALGDLMSFKNSSTFYKPSWDGTFVYFIYYFLFWIMIINLLVAIFNMLPLEILDGGRFFYLTMLGIFKSEKVAKVVYKIMGYAILLAFVLMMFFWFINVI